MLADHWGNTYVSGWFNDSTVIGTDTFFLPHYASAGILMKVNAAGDLIWAKKIGSAGYAQISEMAFDLSGNLLLAGSFSDTLTIGGNTMIASGYNDILVAKYDTAGNPLWALSAGNVGADAASHITCDPFDNIIVGGLFQYASPFPSITLTAYGDADVFVAKLNSTGTVLWAQSCGGMQNEGLAGLTTDAAGDIYLSGKSAFNFNYGAQSWNGFETIFIGKITAAGDLSTVKVSVTGWGTSGICGLEKDASENLYALLLISPDFSFDSILLPNPNQVRMGAIKLDTALNVSWLKTFGYSHTAYMTDMVTDIDGNCYLTGDFQDTLIFGTSVFNSPGFTHYGFVAGIDSSGNEMWAQISTCTNISHLSVDGNRCIRIAGDAFGTETFDTIAITSAGQTDLFLGRLCQLSVGIDNQHVDEIVSVYPNPATDFVSFNNCEQCSSITISNPSGKIIRSGEFSNRLRVSDLSPGIYFITFSNTNGDVLAREKFLKM